MLELQWIASYLALGAVVGFFAGLLGVGGGGIMVPMLTTLFLMQGFPVDNVLHLALGTSMASILVTSCSSAWSHSKRGGVVWRAIKGLGPGALVGTFMGTFLATVMDTKPLAIFFACFMTLVVIQMLVGFKPAAQRQMPGNRGLFGVGTGIGAVSALVSIGGGSLTVPYLLWCNISIRKAIGTSAALGVFIAVAGTLGFFINGSSHVSGVANTFGFVYWPAVILMSLCSFVTAPIGASAAHKLPVTVLKRIFAVLLTLLSIKMLMAIF